MTPLKLSVVINTMGSAHLEKIVKTYLASSLPLEVILVFDDPKIDPSSLLTGEQINDPRTIIERNKTNLGIARATNTGISLSSGDIILRNDDDDIPSQNRVDEIAVYFSLHPDVDIIYSYARGVNYGCEGEWEIIGPEKNEEIQEALLKRNFIVHSSVAFRRSSMDTIGFYDETFRYALDYDLYLRAMRAGLVFGCIPKVLVTRLYHKDSITVAKRKRQILHSMAARLLHAAQVKDDLCIWPIITRYALLLAIPDWARQLRRRLGHGK